MERWMGSGFRNTLLDTLCEMGHFRREFEDDAGFDRPRGKWFILHFHYLLSHLGPIEA